MLTRRTAILNRFSVRALALCTLASSAFMPAHAQQVPTGTNVSVVNSPKGAAVVNITTPNSQGVSHNVFTQFDVQAKGVVLNNNARSGNSALGGYIRGNANIKTKPASLIINEVVNSNAASQLNGGVEVFGQKAAVVIANPNGINCNGCTFTNASRVTLAAARPQIVSGKLSKFSAASGGVKIDSKGLGATTVDLLEIIGRTVEVSGRISAKDLIISAGNHAYAYDTKTASAVAGGDEITSYSIESLTGSMVASNIRLISTGSGLGVNLAVPLTSGKDVIIQSDGDVSFARMTAVGNINVATKGALASKNYIRASGHILLNGNSVDLGSGVISMRNTAIKSNTSINIANNDSVSGVRAGAVHFGKAPGTPTKITLTAGGLIDAGTAPILGNTVVVDAQGFKQAVNGTIKADNVAITARDTIATSGLIEATASMKLKAPNVRSFGTLKAVDLGISATEVELAGAITGDRVVIAGDKVVLKGEIATSDKLDVSDLGTGGWLVANGEIVSAGSVSLVNRGEISLAGTTKVGKDLNVSGSFVYIDGNVEADNGADNKVSIEASDDVYQDWSSSISSNSPIFLKVGNAVFSYGNIKTNSTLNGSGQFFIFGGNIVSKGSAIFDATNMFYITGSLTTENDLVLRSRYDVSLSRGSILNIGKKLEIDAGLGFDNLSEEVNAGELSAAARYISHFSDNLNVTGNVSLLSRNVPSDVVEPFDPEAFVDPTGIAIYGGINSLSGDVSIASQNGTLELYEGSAIRGKSAFLSGVDVSVDGLVAVQNAAKISGERSVGLLGNARIEVSPGEGNSLDLNAPAISNQGYITAPVVNVVASESFVDSGVIEGSVVRN